MNYFSKKMVFTLICVLTIVCSSCSDEPEFHNTPSGNFEACWKILNERYCFFQYKNIDWQLVHNKYSKLVKEDMNNEALFKVLADMLAELKDGHVNLYTPFDVARYWKWYEDYPDNFDSKIQRNYLGYDYLIASGMKYKIISKDIGYMHYGSFSNPISESGIDQILLKFANCKGIIIDVRDNGGGSLGNVDLLAGRFTEERVISGYIKHKTGKGHTDFSDLFPYYLNPSIRYRYKKPVAVLTNRRSFSATNNFVGVMRTLPTVFTVGDKTGGGSGLPFSSELPNGWSLRFSASPIYDPNKEQTEFGIDPDIKQDMTANSMAMGLDSIIEKAISEIRRRNP